MAQFNLKHTVEHFETDLFPELVIEHIKAVSTKIPLQTVCADGAWPDDKSLQLTLTDAVSYNGAIDVTLHAVFNAVTCSACFGAESETVEHTISIIIDRETGIATVTL